ncbi:MAG TPA: single-stranded DNA-binding protein [Streptosporangiaceae bacterium]|jgi:single-strand DNA-binding protein
MSTTITTEGNLTADPEVHYVAATGNAVCNLTLAVSARRKNIDGEYVDTPPVFLRATCWGALAERVAESLRKGDRVLVHGTTYDEEWTDREGNTRTTHVLHVQAIGASLRYASVRVTRAAKTDSQAGPAGSSESAGAEVIELH